jgi:hypothetical protein
MLSLFGGIFLLRAATLSLFGEMFLLGGGMLTLSGGIFLLREGRFLLKDRKLLLRGGTSGFGAEELSFFAGSAATPRIGGQSPSAARSRR